MPQVVQPAGIARLAVLHPFFAALAAFPGAGGEAQHLDLDGAALQRAGQDVAAHRRHRDRPAAHRPGVVDQQAHDGVAKFHVEFAFVGQRLQRVDHNPGEAAGIQHPLVEVELPGPGLLRQQASLQPVRELRDHPCKCCNC